MGHYSVCCTFITFSHIQKQGFFCLKEIQKQLTWDVVLLLGCYGNTYKKTENTAAMKTQKTMQTAQI